MSFFNLFLKNLINCKIKDSDFTHNNSVKNNNFDYLSVTLSPSNSMEKYAVDELINKLKLDNGHYTFNNYESLNDQLQKISEELDKLKLNNTIKGGEPTFEEIYNKFQTEQFKYDDLIYVYQNYKRYPKF